MKNIPEYLAEDLSFCRERVAEFDPWYGLHKVFAQPDQACRKLSLYAFFSMMERAAAMTEPSLCGAQLAWWKSEVGERAASSAHPVVRSLRFSGTLPVLSDGALPGLFSQALIRVQKSPVANVEGLRAFCDEIGNAFFAPEVSLASPECRFADYTGSCAGTGLWRLVHLAGRSPDPGFWFVPLDLQARYGESVDRIGVETGTESSALQALGEMGALWFDAQLDDLIHQDRTAAQRNSQLIASLLAQKRQLSLALESLSRPGRRPVKAGPIELLRLWSNTRRLSRR